MHGFLKRWQIEPILFEINIINAKVFYSRSENLDLLGLYLFPV